MDGSDRTNNSTSLKGRFWLVCLALLGVTAFVVVSITLEDQVGIKFDTTYRVACATACLLFINKLRTDYPDESWPRNGLLLAVLINIGIFFTPLIDRPSSRGELMLFALPDAAAVLAVMIATYRATDVHERAARQMMIVGLMVALIFCLVLCFFTLAERHTGRP